MKKLKINLDRTNIKSENIAAKQDFDYILRGYEKTKSYMWRNLRFYGSEGVATIAILLSTRVLNKNMEEDENKSTLKEKVEFSEYYKLH